MKIELVKIDDLKPFKNNAKKHPQTQIDNLKRLIQSVGFTQPIVIDENKVIVAGHGRLLAAKELGMEKVPCLKLSNLSEATIRQYRLADNKFSETEWDMGLVFDELRELETLPDFDLSVTGFNLPDFEPNLPEIGEIDESEPKFQVVVILQNDDEQLKLFNELKDRGFKVRS